MSSQMSVGVIAYELTTGQPATKKDIVNIFDYEENNLTNSPHDQVKFFNDWLKSLGATHYKDLGAQLPE